MTNTDNDNGTRIQISELENQFPKLISKTCETCSNTIVTELGFTWSDNTGYYLVSTKHCRACLKEDPARFGAVTQHILPSTTVQVPNQHSTRKQVREKLEDINQMKERLTTIQHLCQTLDGDYDDVFELTQIISESLTIKKRLLQQERNRQ